jgi:hypothetical protein
MHYATVQTHESNLWRENICTWGGAEPLDSLHTAVTCSINSGKEVLLGAILGLQDTKLLRKYTNFWGNQVNFGDPNKWRKFQKFSWHINLNVLPDYYKLEWLKVANIKNMYFLPFTDAVTIYTTIWDSYLHLHQTIIVDSSLWRYVQMERLRTMLQKASLDFLVCQSTELRFTYQVLYVNV